MCVCVRVCARVCVRELLLCARASSVCAVFSYVSGYGCYVHGLLVFGVDVHDLQHVEVGDVEVGCAVR